ncbi:MAG TPA: hypothetical protein VGR47_15295 [Terracidiphilus sp.]|nr:hypothetical protein [Terracidiphilus sp.]
MSMKSTAFILATVLGVSLFALAAPSAVAQKSDYGSNSFSGSDVEASQNWEEARPVEAALNRFDYALANHDVAMLQAAGVDDASAKLWQRFFSENPEATVTDRCPVSELSISLDVGYWTCTETVTIVSEGKPLAFLHVIHFTFAKKRGVWLVARRR